MLQLQTHMAEQMNTLVQSVRMLSRLTSLCVHIERFSKRVFAEKKHAIVKPNAPITEFHHRTLVRISQKIETAFSSFDSASFAVCIRTCATPSYVAISTGQIKREKRSSKLK